MSETRIDRDGNEFTYVKKHRAWALNVRPKGDRLPPEENEIKKAQRNERRAQRKRQRQAKKKNRT